MQRTASKGTNHDRDLLLRRGEQVTKLQLSDFELLELAEKLFHEVHPFSGSLDSHDLRVHWIREALEAIEYYNTVNEFLHEIGLNNSNDIKKVIS